MPGRKSFLLRLPQELYDEIAGWAEQELRSVNGQIEFLLRAAVRARGRRDPEDRRRRTAAGGEGPPARDED
jgi:hypothetical protein